MSTKVKRYGWKRTDSTGVVHKTEYETEALRDRAVIGHDDRKYTVTRTVRAKGRPLWWAIRQLQEGRAVVDGDGDRWGVYTLRELLEDCASEPCPAWAQSWTLAEVGS